MPDPARLDLSRHGREDLPPLLLLHAGGMTRREWTPFLGAWESRFHLITPSAPGHGASAPEPGLSLDSMAETMLRLLDQLGIASFSVVGSSMGGATALRMALRAPGRVERLVLYRSGFRVAGSMREALARFATPENWRAWGLERWMEREHLPQGGPQAWQSVIQRVAALFDRPDASLDRADLERIESPTLLIGGDRDPLVPLADLVTMRDAIPRCALWIVPDAGHVMAMETWRKPAFTEEIARFLRRATPSGPSGRS